MKKIKIFILIIILYFININSYEAEKYNPKILRQYLIPWFEYEESVARFGFLQNFSDKAGFFTRTAKYLYNEKTEDINVFFNSRNKGNIITDLNIEVKNTEEKYLGLYFYPEKNSIKKTFSKTGYNNQKNIAVFYSNSDYNTSFPVLEGNLYGIELKNIYFSNNNIHDYNRIIGNHDFLLTAIETVCGDENFSKMSVRSAYNIFQSDKLTFRVNAGFSKIYNLEKNWVNALLKNGSSGLHIRGLSTEVYAEELNFRNGEMIFPVYSNFNIRFYKFYSLSIYNRIFVDKGKFKLDSFEKSYKTYGNELIIRTVLMGKIPLNIVLSFYKDENEKTDHYSYFLFDLN